MKNAGFMIWRNDAVARRSAADWTEDCLRWCYDHAEPDGRFMNQGYLSRWPDRYPGVAVIAHPGANLALWNVENHRLEASSRGVTVDGEPLVFFHYSSMGTSSAGDWYSLFALPDALAPLLRERIFAPYFESVAAISRRVMRRYGISGTGTARTFPWGRATWLTGWRARMPGYRVVQRAVGLGVRVLGQWWRCAA